MILQNQMINEKTQLNMVIGHPLLHTKSPVLHDVLYKELGINAVLLPFSNTDLKKLISAIRAMSINLTAVTMPFKQSIIPLLDSVDGTASSVGAVNTVINRDNKLIGYNTDIFGIEYALRGTPLRGKNVLLIGAGGAATALAYVIKNNGGKCIYANRALKKARRLQKLFGGKIARIENLSSKDIDIIINATPVGMHPDIKSSPVPIRLIDKHQTVFDLVYNPVQTKLIKEARKNGAKTISGIDMFIAQGIKQIELWTGKKIITPKLIGRLKKKIIKN